MIRNRPFGGLFIACLLIHSSLLSAANTATISGTVTSAEDGTPIVGATVVASISRFNYWVGNSDAGGNYSIEVDIIQANQSVYLEAGSPSHHPSRFGVIEQPQCYFGCPGDGAIAIAAGDVLPNVNISLSSGGGHFGGTVLAADTGGPLQGIRVRPFARTETFIAQFSELFFGVTEADGTYQTPLALPAGEYHVLTHSDIPPYYSTRALGNTPCQYDSCAIRASEQLIVNDGEISSNVDFVLTPAARIAGTLFPDDINRIISIFDAAGGQIQQEFLPAGSAGWEFDRLSGGSYFIQLGPFTGAEPYVRQLHNGLDCPFSGCERASGSPLTVGVGGSLNSVDIVLTQGGQITGRLVDGATGTAPAVDDQGRSMGLYNIVQADGTVVGGGAISFEEGEIRLQPSGAVPPGDYYVRTYGTWSGDSIGYQHPALSPKTTIPGFADAAYPDVACAGSACDLSGAQTVSFSAGTLIDITIHLSQGSDVTGSVVDDATNLGLQRAIVELIDASNRRLAATWTDDDGNFSFGAFPAGTYYLRTAMSSSLGEGMGPIQLAYFDRVHGAPDQCSEWLCNPTSGEPIGLDGTNPAGPLQLRVSAGPVIRGRVFDQLSGLLITRGNVEVRDDLDRLVGVYKINPLDGWYQTTALPPGTYSIVPVVSSAFLPVPTPVASPETASAAPRNRPAGGFLVALGTETVEANLVVVDRALDQVFKDGFRGTGPSE